MGNDHVIDDGLKTANALVDARNFQGALHMCNELLKINPYHKDLKKTLDHVQRLILQANEKKVNADIDATMHLWDEKKYDELLKIYVRLYPFAPQNARLRGLIEKLKTTLMGQVRNDQVGLMQKVLDEAKKLFAEGKIEEAFQKGMAFYRSDPTNQACAEFLKNVKRAYIEKKLEDNIRLMESANFERQADFYDSLLSIDPEHAHVKRLSFQAKAHIAEQRQLAEKIRINESVARMKEMFKAAEYEKVLQSCAEILRADPGNWNARVFHEKALETIAAEIEALSLKKMKEAAAEMEADAKKNPGGYVRI